jgi:hypothetical protein
MTAQYLRHLALVDLSLAESLGNVYPETCARARLRLALFIDYVAAQKLGPGEVALLMGNGAEVLDEALGALVKEATGTAAGRTLLARMLQGTPAGAMPACR